MITLILVGLGLALLAVAYIVLSEEEDSSDTSKAAFIAKILKDNADKQVKLL